MKLEIAKAEVSHPNEECPTPLFWHCHDDLASEVEVTDFLGALAWLLKPEFALETGCHHGRTTEAIARGLRRNGRGVLYSCDTDKVALKECRRRLREANLLGQVALLNETGVTAIQQLGDRQVGLAFLDSGLGPDRVDELRALVPKLAPGGIIAVHDTGPQHWVRPLLRPAVAELGLNVIELWTPRGLALLGRRP